MSTLFFRDGEAVECELGLLDLKALYNAVKAGHAEVRIKIIIRKVREMKVDLRYLDELRTFATLQEAT